MMSTAKPAIILAHGAWHSPAHYNPFKTTLEAEGYEVFIPALPSRTDQPGVTWREDVAFIHALVEPHMDAGKEFVIACHSYGGIPGCVATKGYTVGERRKEGKNGGFRAILFVAAFAVPRAGMDLLGCFQGKYPPWMIYQPKYQRNTSCFVKPEAKHAFYNDIPDEEAQRCFDALGAQSQDSFETPVDFAAPDLKIPSTFLICEGDAAMPPAFQEILAVGTPGMKIERCSAGHSSFISQPDRVVEVLKSL
ncbi:Alpha/beta hydrolase fold-1 [Hypoxylon crocopeplum]|nr:Alpha/beta hydrolase fold-1 [Hypoxylon crocopeplum]